MRNLYLFLAMFIGASAYGQTTFLEENFDYDSVVEIRTHGWSAHSAGGTNPILVSAEGLSLPNTMYAGNNIGRAAWVINNGSDENKPFNAWVPQPADGEPNTHTYASFLMKPIGEIPVAVDNTRPYFFHFGEYNDIENPEFTDLSTAFRARTFIYPGTVPNTFQLNLSFNQNEPDPINQTGNYSSDEVHLIVLKYTSIAGEENDEVSLYVFSDGDDISAEPSSPTIGPLTGTNRDVVLQAVSMRQFQDSQNVMVDGIIVRDHWDMTGGSTSTSERTVSTDMKVFPNPVQVGEINISTGFQGQMDVRIHDITGRTIQAGTITDGRMNISGLSQGAYFVNVQQGGRAFIQKLIVQ